MAVFKPEPVLFQRHALSLAVALACSCGLASYSKPLLADGWDCKAEGDQWACQPKGKSTSTSSTGSRLKPGQTEAPGTHPPLDTPERWDWISQDQLRDPTRCDTGCTGAYEAPVPHWPNADQDPEGARVYASADRSRSVGQLATLEGNVVISQGYRLLNMHRATLNRSNSDFEGTGDISLREPSLLVRADQLSLNIDTGLGSFHRAQFLQHEAQMRGGAETIRRSAENQLDLEKTYLTRCPPGEEDWTLHASHIHLNNEEGWGSAHHARLNVGKLPVFYFPYMTFPVDERRKSGFLWPSLGTSNQNGFEISAPYYFNLAPNYDATLAPRFIEKRGLMTELELRHLSENFGRWNISGAHLDDDSYDREQADSDDRAPREKRWAGALKLQGKLSVLHTLIDYTRVSDNDFLDDFSTDSLELQRMVHLNQQAGLSYTQGPWQAELMVRQFQTLDDDLDEQYQFMPRINIERLSYGKSFSLNWELNAEFTQFEHEESRDKGGTFTTGDRSYGELGISYPMNWAAGFITPGLKLRSVNYQLDATLPDEADTASTSTPLGSLDMGLFFEREAGAYTQTLEPRLFYLYSDYEDQDDQPNFDTRELDFSYSQLFRDTRFSGHDRLDDANQLSVGLSSRFIENSRGFETLSLSLGQIFYFEDRRVQLDGTQQRGDGLTNSEIVTEVQYQPNESTWMTQTLRWDSRQDYLNEGGFSLHYRADSESLYNLSYRYRRNGTRTLDSGITDLSQADASLTLPIADRWKLYARYRYDIEEHRAIDDMLGLRYEDCCWAVSLIYQRAFDEERQNALTNETYVKRDHLFILEFQLKGLGSLGKKAYNILRDSILGYEDLEH